VAATARYGRPRDEEEEEANDHGQAELEKRPTWVARMTAPRARKSVMCEVRLKGPVSHTPGGTYSSVPPRAPRRRSMRATARANAAVLSVRPSPTAPKPATDIHAPRRGGAGAAPEHVSCAPAGASSSSTAASRHSGGVGILLGARRAAPQQWVQFSEALKWSKVRRGDEQEGTGRKSWCVPVLWLDVRATSM